VIEKVFVALLLISGAASAGTQDAVPTCFSDKLIAPKGVTVETELFVVIDQTTPLDAGLRQSVANNIKPFLKAGNAISVTQFSAFAQGRYTDVLAYAKLDPELPHDLRNDVSKPVLSKFDQCQAAQPRLAGRAIGGALRSAFSGSSSGIDKSDVLASLKAISGKVKQSTAKRKIVLLASDMLENSSVSSFYARQAVRQILPEKELELVKENELFGDFGGAEVYVIGAGLLAEGSGVPKGVYRSPQIMGALKSFWSQWFEKSKARLIEFGAPALLNQIH
jgi:hypothetical protein